MFKRILGIFVVACALPAYASVQTQVWNFDNTNHGTNKNTQRQSGGNGSNGVGNFISWTGDDNVQIHVSAWSETINDNKFCNDFPTAPECIPDGSDPTTTTLDPYIDKATLKYYDSSLGIENQDGEGGAPQHSIDNIPNYTGNAAYNDYDAVLVQFDQKTNLSSIDIGWATNDGDGSSDGSADISIVAYTGNNDLNNNPFFATTSTWGSLLTNGWSRIGHYQNAGGSYAIANNAATEIKGVLSKYWLISAYNPLFGGTALSNANDGFKLAGLTTTTGSNDPSTPVPAPASFALLALCAVGMVVRRKK